MEINGFQLYYAIANLDTTSPCDDHCIVMGRRARAGPLRLSLALRLRLAGRCEYPGIIIIVPGEHAIWRVVAWPRRRAGASWSAAAALPVDWQLDFAVIWAVTGIHRITRYSL